MQCHICLPVIITGKPFVPSEFTAIRRLSAEEIVKIICVFFEVGHEKITSKRRWQDVVIPRQLAMFFLKEKTAMSLKGIGQLLGGFDHTTVLHSIQVVNERMQTEDKYNRNVHILKYLMDKATWS